MKILRTLPFIVTALLVVWGSAAGVGPAFTWVMAVLLTIIALVISLFGYAESPSTWGGWAVEERPGVQKQRLRVIGLSLALIFSTATLQWPLRACFWLSRPALERIAQQAERAPIEEPRSAGLFTIQEAYVNKGEIVLWLDGDGGEPTILVRKLPGHKLSRFGGGDTVDLDSNWYFYSEM